MSNTISTSQKIFIMTLGLVFSYWLTTRLHAHYCAPSGLYGLFWTPLMMGSPFCLAAIQIMNKTTEIYSAIWLGLIGSLFTFLYSIYESISNISNTSNTSDFKPKSKS